MEIETIRKLVSDGNNAQTIATMQRVTKKKVLTFVKDHNLGPWRYGPCQRSIPDDFAIIGATMTREAAQRHYKCGTQTALRWYNEAGISPARYTQQGRKMIAPLGLAAKVQGLNFIEAAKVLGVNRKTASRLMRETGLVAERVKSKPVQRIATIVKPFRKPMGQPIAPMDRYQRDMSAVGQAVDFLRALGPVFKDGDKWRRGNTLLTGAEIIERATWRGWVATGLMA